MFIDAHQLQILFDLNMQSKDSTFGLAKHLLALKTAIQSVLMCAHIQWVSFVPRLAPL